MLILLHNVLVEHLMDRGRSHKLTQFASDARSSSAARLKCYSHVRLILRCWASNLFVTLGNRWHQLRVIIFWWFDAIRTWHAQLSSNVLSLFNIGCTTLYRLFVSRCFCLNSLEKTEKNTACNCRVIACKAKSRCHLFAYILHKQVCV